MNGAPLYDAMVAAINECYDALVVKNGMDQIADLAVAARIARTLAPERMASEIRRRAEREIRNLLTEAR